MAKGFTDSSGKFRPTKKNDSTVSSKQVSKTSKESNPDNKKADELKNKKMQNPVVSKKLKQMFRDQLGEDDIEAFDFNPKWKLLHLFGDDGTEYFHFPDEKSAIAFGRQSIKDTAGEHIPEEGNPEREEYLKLSDDEVVDKVIEEQTNHGLDSELSGIAKSVAGADGQFTELEDGSIVFQIS